MGKRNMNKFGYSSEKNFKNVSKSSKLNESDVKAKKVSGKKRRKQKLKEEKKQKRMKLSGYSSASVVNIKERKIDNSKLKLAKKQKEEKTKELHNKKKALLEDNKEEERTIHTLERLLYMNKKNKNKLPSSFSRDGLDYLLDIVDKPGSDEEQDEVDDSNAYDDTSDDASEDGYNDKLLDVERSNETNHDSRSEEKHVAFNDNPLEENDNSDEEDNLMVDVAPENSASSAQLVKKTLDSLSTSIIPKYIPPARQAITDDEASKKQRLKRQVKGLLNRLSEANIYSICSEIGSIYELNSRAFVTQVLCELILTQFYTPDPIPERLITESVMLIAILCQNIGPSIVGHFLENAIKKLYSLLQIENYGSGKECNNVVQLIASLYQLGVIQIQVIRDIIDLFIDSFKEKDIEMLVLVFKAVGFQIRKDDPVSLKSMVEKITLKSHEIEFSEASRMKYMLEVLTAIKNNNIRKILGYDAETINNRKKKIKSASQKETDAFPNVTLQDLIDADTKGRWWIVGSAWSGTPMLKDAPSEITENVNAGVSSELIKAAKRLRMNTDIRRKIFYAVMSSEDFEEAFEKVLKIGLKGKQLREIGHVLVECCQRERSFNPFYYYLLNKFCHHERQFVMSVQCSFWDRFKLFDSFSAQQMTNIATLLAKLILSEAIPLSCLKAIEYSDMDKPIVSFLRQILCYIAANANSMPHLDTLCGKLLSSKLSSVRNGLRLFLQHFMLFDATFMQENMDIKDALTRIDSKLGSHKTSIVYESLVY